MPMGHLKIKQAWFWSNCDRKISSSTLPTGVGSASLMTVPILTLLHRWIKGNSLSPHLTLSFEPNNTKEHCIEQALGVYLIMHDQILT